MRHFERHRTTRINWLRAADRLHGEPGHGGRRRPRPPGQILVAGVAGLVAGAFSMAAGEYVSVSSQADTERADLARDRAELATDREGEELELAGTYIERGLEPALALTVARQLMAKDAVGAYARDELGISGDLAARPIQAALASAITFAVGAGLPVLAVTLVPEALLGPVVAGAA